MVWPGAFLLVLAGCAPKQLDTPETERARLLAELDVRWENRAQPGELDAVVQAWLGQLGARPDDPVVLARLARAAWTSGWLDADPRQHESGSDFGFRCLLTWPTFANASQLDAYRIQQRAVALLPAEAAPCLTWTILNGLALAQHRGAGAALDLEAIGALLAHLDTLGTTEDPGFVPWADGMLLVLVAAPASPPAAARERFAAAIAAAPGVLLFRRSFAETFPDAAGRAMDGFVVPNPDPWALENAAWKQ